MYRPRDAEHTVLHQVIAEHLEAFLAAVVEAGDGAGLPQFVEREFREFLQCGVLAPRARWRERVVTYGGVAPEAMALAPPLAAGPDGSGAKSSPRTWTWAALVHRVFAIDVLACPECGSRLRFIATLHDPAVIRKILAHVGRAPPRQSPGPSPPAASAATP